VWDIVGSMNPAESGLDGPEDATEAAAGTRPRFGSAMSWSSASSAMSAMQRNENPLSSAVTRAENGQHGPEDATEAAAGTRPRFGSAMSWSSASSAMSRPRFGSAMSWTEAVAATDKSQHGDEAPCDALVNRILSACRSAFAAPDASSQEQADAVSCLVEVHQPPKPSTPNP